MLELKNISKIYESFELKNISFSVKEGDYFVLLGESGAGKSIILEIIAGLIESDNGSIIMKNEDITKQKIQDRNIGLVFQDFAIFPHLLVKDNIAYAIKHKKFQHSK